ncbi:hypothetical protein N7491_010532 [Penicillium cf. griseofulvum]|uniref:Uncharacterized protein n=1 Tax=Penicillium cf. griseofulvum TaxID=2972120 RepID=A0A9W9T5X1_9EURO|nr:hypothetical protein N7472_000862 [Penicillium cf. griseofulvum]KAJ5422087.1 hypothetical protein N7491_010532 [Penicillium cf. griseofulvum]
MFSILFFISLFAFAKADDNWDDFTNNLATDLAPLIVLFGERLTKQFLSESISILDNVIFALSPLGVLTAVVSVIRICGSSSLRAFVGRAQEGPAEAESELLPCVSQSTSELFNDGGITRVFGRPKILEVVVWEDVYHKETVTRVDTLKGALLAKAWSCNREVSPFQLSELNIPNLSLNTGIKRRGQFWFYCAAIIGGVLQIGTVVYAALTVFIYPQKFQKDDKAVASYAFPLYLIGTILLFIGMFFCAFILERSSKEYYFKAEKPSKIYWLQPGNQHVGDQVFHAFLAVKEGPRSSMSKDLRYIKSARDRRFDRKYLEVYSTLASTIMGFIFQFIGLRGLHASVILAQLGSTFLMAIIRTCLRTERMDSDDNIMKDDRELLAHKQQELDCFAFHLEKAESFNLSPLPDQPLNTPSERRTSYSKMSLGMRLFERRENLAILTSNSNQSFNNVAWDEMPIRQMARNLAKLIESTMDLITSWGVEFEKTFEFQLGFECKSGSPGSETQSSPQTYIELLRHGDDMRWKVRVSEMEAILGLWTWSLCKSDNSLATAKLSRLVGLDKEEAAKEETYLYFRKWIFSAPAERLIPDFIDDSKRLFGVESKHTRSQSKHLAIWTPNGVEMMAAQDIFIQFLKTAFLQLKDLGGQVDVNPSIYRYRPPLGSSTRVDELVSCFEAHSLGSRQDALLCIIPALKNRGLLPVLAADSPKIRARKEEFIKQGNWEDAFGLLRWLCERSEGHQLELSVYELGFLCRRALLSNSQIARQQGFEQTHKLLRSDIRDGFIPAWAASGWTKSQERIRWWDGFCIQLGWIAWSISTKVPETKFMQPTLASFEVPEELSGWNDAGHDAQEIQKSMNAIEGWLTSPTLDCASHSPGDYDEIACDWTIRNNYHALLYFLLLIWIELGEDCPALIMRAYSFASKNRSDLAFKTLLRYKADIDAGDPDDRTALIDRIMNRDLDGAKILLQHGANPNGGDQSHGPLLLSLGMGEYDIAEFLLLSGASVDVVDRRGFSVMWWACSSGKVEMVDLVLRHKAAIDPVGPDGTTPLLYYAEKGKVEMARFLISKGASTKFDDMSGRAALMPAAKDKSVPNITLLLEDGPDVVVKGTDGRTAGFSHTGRTSTLIL